MKATSLLIGIETKKPCVSDVIQKHGHMRKMLTDHFGNPSIHADGSFATHGCPCCAISVISNFNRLYCKLPGVVKTPRA